MKYKLSIIISLALISGFTFATFLYIHQPATADNLSFDEQEATIRAIKKNLPAVVNITVYEQRDVPELSFLIGSSSVESSQKKEKVKVGVGTGFLISSDGLILTNRHVVDSATDGEYRIRLNGGKEYYAQFIGKDPINDLAVLKIFDKNLPFVELGDSAKLEIGSTVIAIGNALGQYQNSVSKGIVSAKGRDIMAGDALKNPALLSNAMQIDAEINLGNSGGPLLDLNGKVVGVNVAIDEAGRSIGFAIPVDDIKPVVRSVLERGRIVRPRLGVRYLMLTDNLVTERKLARNNGALITGSPEAVTPGGSADKAGLKEGDIIFEVNAISIDAEHTLISVVSNYKPGDKIGMKVQRGNKVLILTATLDEFRID